MPVMDEFREEREALKNGTLKEKLKYFWYYYKWHTVAVIVGVICVISFAKNILSVKDNALSVAMLNCAPIRMDDSEFREAYAQFAGIDLKKYEVRFDTNLNISSNGRDQASVNSMQRLMVNIVAKDLDIMMGSGSAFAQYANNNNLCDLRNILSEEQISRYEPYFYYMDRAFAERLDQARSELADTADMEIPDPTKPEAMEQPVPVAIFIDSSKLEEYYYFQTDEHGLALGVIANTQQTEHALAFIDYLMQL